MQAINRAAYEEMLNAPFPSDRAYAKMGLFIATNAAIEYTDGSRVFLVESDPFTNPAEQDTRWSTYWNRKGQNSLHHYQKAPYFKTPAEAQAHLNEKAKAKKWEVLGPRQIEQAEEKD